MSAPQLHVVTGAFGYSGKYIAKRLLQEGRRVRTLTNSVRRPDPFAGQVEADIAMASVKCVGLRWRVQSAVTFEPRLGLLVAQGVVHPMAALDLP